VRGNVSLAHMTHLAAHIIKAVAAKITSDGLGQSCSKYLYLKYWGFVRRVFVRLVPVCSVTDL
jgi:hypothetical protein